MSRSVNKIILIGNVGRDPDIQQTKSGMKVAHFAVATNRRVPAGSEEEGAFPGRDFKPSLGRRVLSGHRAKHQKQREDEGYRLAASHHLLS